MKKILLLSIPILLCLCSCQSNPSDETKVEPQTENETSQIQDESSEDESLESEPTSESEESLESDSSVDGGTYQLTYDDVPSPVSGSYPTAQEITTADNTKFFISEVMKGGGDYDNHIQIKKSSGYFYNTTPVIGNLTFKILRQNKYYESEDHDFTGTLTVYVSDALNEGYTKLSPSKTSQDDNYNYYSFEAGAYHYYKITNESKYAAYVPSFTWAY